MALSNIPSDLVLDEEATIKLMEEINKLRKDMDELKNCLQKSELVISAQVQEIMDIRSIEEKSRQDMELLRRETEDTEKFIREMGVQLGEQRRSIVELKTSGERRDREMAELRIQMDREREKEDEMQLTLDIMREEIQDMRNEMDRIRGVPNFREGMGDRERER